MSEEDSLLNEFLSALEVFDRATSPDDFLRYWQGTNALLRYGHRVRGRFDAQIPSDGKTVRVIDRLKSCCAKQSVTALAAAFEKIYPKSWQDPHLKAGPDSQQPSSTPAECAAHLIRGYLHAALAVHQVQVPKEDCSSALEICRQSFEKAWPVSGSDKVGSLSNFEGTRSEPVDQLLGKLTTIEATHWLLLRRLFSHLLGVDDRPVDLHQVHTWFLGAGLEKQADSAEVPLEVWRLSEAICGWYPDPVTLGVTVVDARFMDSMRIAWRLLPEDWPRAGVPGPRALRIVPRVKSLVLFGGSAAASLACAVYAAATDKYLADDVTISAAIRLAEDAPAAGPLTLGQVTLDVVNSQNLDWKLRKSRRKRVLLRTGQQKNGNNWKTWSQQPQTGAENIKLQIIGVETLFGAWQQMEGFQGLEDVLEHAGSWVEKHWDEFRPKPFIEPHLEWRNVQPVDDKNPDHRTWQATFDPVLKNEKNIEIKWTKPDGSADAPDSSNQTQIGNRELGLLVQRAWSESESADLLVAGNGPRRGLRLAIAVDANIGKTVFSRRAQWYFTDPDPEAGRSRFFSGRRIVAYRCENHGQNSRWPAGDDSHQVKESLLRGLAQHLIDTSTASDTASDLDLEAATVLARYLMRSGRVVLILDAMDQTPSNHVEYILQALSKNPPDIELAACHVIITGRQWAFTTDDRRSQFEPAPEDGRCEWTIARLQPFDANQQSRFLHDILPKEYQIREHDDLSVDTVKFRKVFNGRYDDLQDLLGVAGLLSMVRKLIEKSKTGQVAAFRSRAAIHWAYHHRLFLQSAIDKDYQHLKNASKLWEGLWEAMLSVIAFRMVLERLDNFTLIGKDRVPKLKRDVQKYCMKLIDNGVLDCSCENNDDWWNGRFSELVQFSSLCQNNILEPDHAGEETLSFVHKSWMEFWCGRFFSKFVDQEALESFDYDSLHTQLQNRLKKDEVQPIDKTKPGYWDRADAKTDDFAVNVLLQIANDPSWAWAWRNAIDMPFVEGDKVKPSYPAPAISEQSLKLSFTALYAPQKRGRRPTELMYEAWVLFEEERLLGESPFGSRLKDTGEAVIADFQAQFQARLRCHELVEDFRLDPANLNKKLAEQDDFAVAPSKGKNKTKAQLARELVPDHTRRRPWFATMLRRLAQLFGRLTGIRTPHQTEFVRCPPAGKQHDRTASPDDVVALREAVTTELSKLADVLSKDDLPIDQRLCVLARRDRIVRLYGAKGEKAQDLEWFFQGSPDGVGYDDERPQHKVWLQPFWMLTTPVTVEQYCGLFDLQHHAEFKDGFRQYASDPRCPVILTDWYDSFCFALFVGAELPAETEWEYACRAGTETKYWFGDSESELEHHAWYSKNSGNRTHVVGELASHGNPWGLFEMHGNVWEWCLDWWDGAAAYQDRIDKAGGRKIGSIAVVDDRLVEFVGGGSRVLRGGSVCVVAVFCRSARRGVLRPGLRDVIGFRLLVRG
jgi:formylglycine-generating enzyme required for sulfatase activity